MLIKNDLFHFTRTQLRTHRKELVLLYVVELVGRRMGLNTHCLENSRLGEEEEKESLTCLK